MKNILVILFAFCVICLQAQEIQKEGVEINGIIWATSNAGADNPEDYGNFYTWDEAQNACPAGWRLPRIGELGNLLRSGNEWITVNGKMGRKFGSGSNSVFLPAAGYCTSGGKWYDNTSGYYWSSTAYSKSNAYNFVFDETCRNTSNPSKKMSFSVRCVAE